MKMTDAESRAVAIEVALHAYAKRPGRVPKVFGAYADATWPADALLGVIVTLESQIHAELAFRRVAR